MRQKRVGFTGSLKGAVIPGVETGLSDARINWHKIDSANGLALDTEDAPSTLERVDDRELRKAAATKGNGRKEKTPGLLPAGQEPLAFCSHLRRRMPLLMETS